jgi:hypothetical protein
MDVAMASTFAIEQLVRHIYASLQDPTAPSSINIKNPSPLRPALPCPAKCNAAQS